PRHTMNLFSVPSVLNLFLLLRAQKRLLNIASRSLNSSRSDGPRQQTLNTKRAAASASALHVRVIELKPRALERLNVINLHSIEVHRTHLVHGHFQAVEIEHFIRVVGLVLKSHVILKSRAASAHHRHA